MVGQPKQWGSGGGYTKVNSMPPMAGPAILTLATIGRTGQETLLQSAKVYLRGRGNRSIKATLVFDTGADRSYVASDIIKKLHSTRVTQEWVSYAGFGDEDGSPCELRPVHEVEISDRHGKSHFIQVPEVA